MTTKQELSDLNIPATVLRKLEDIAVVSVRQLCARLRHESAEMQEYLQLSDEEFAGFRREIEDVIQTESPEDTLPRIRPVVNKSGVAVHRLHDPTRPKYNARGEK